MNMPAVCVPGSVSSAAVVTLIVVSISKTNKQNHKKNKIIHAAVVPLCRLGNEVRYDMLVWSTTA